MIISLQQPPDFNLIKYQNKSAIVAVGRRIISVTKKTKKKKRSRWCWLSFWLDGHHSWVCSMCSIRQWVFYLNIIKCLREKSPKEWRHKTWMLHHDNVPAHYSFYLWIFRNAWDDSSSAAVLLSRFGPCGLFLFLKLKSTHFKWMTRQ